MPKRLPFRYEVTVKNKIIEKDFWGDNCRYFKATNRVYSFILKTANSFVGKTYDEYYSYFLKHFDELDYKQYFKDYLRADESVKYVSEYYNDNGIIRKKVYPSKLERQKSKHGGVLIRYVAIDGQMYDLLFENKKSKEYKAFRKLLDVRAKRTKKRDKKSKRREFDYDLLIHSRKLAILD